MSKKLPLHLLTPAQKAKIAARAKAWSEPNLALMVRVWKVLGTTRAMELVVETEQVAANGGMLVADGSRQRSTGGIFFQLCRQQCRTRERYRTFAGQPPLKARPEPPLPTPELIPDLTQDFTPDLVERPTEIPDPVTALTPDPATMRGSIPDPVLALADLSPLFPPSPPSPASPPPASPFPSPASRSPAPPPPPPASKATPKTTPRPRRQPQKVVTQKVASPLSPRLLERLQGKGWVVKEASKRV
jgi:hypothetical protein